jgi:hypothetical protein
VRARRNKKNAFDAYTLTNTIAKKAADGSVAIHSAAATEDPELPANHEGLELHGAPLPTARRGFE